MLTWDGIYIFIDMDDTDLDVVRRVCKLILIENRFSSGRHGTVGNRDRARRVHPTLDAVAHQMNTGQIYASAGN